VASTCLETKRSSSKLQTKRALLDLSDIELRSFRSQAAQHEVGLYEVEPENDELLGKEEIRGTRRMNVSMNVNSSDKNCSFINSQLSWSSAAIAQ